MRYDTRKLCIQGSDYHIEHKIYPGQGGDKDNGNKFLLKIVRIGVPVMAQWLTNPTRNHEVAGSIPALAQWVNDPALP